MRITVAAILLLWLIACERREPPREPPLPSAPSQAALEHRMEREIERLATQAGVELEDPETPAGSLLQEIESFSTLEACVALHLPRDPLLGDALDALGYDTLTRDACRIVEALSARDPKRCAPILASPLRAHCETAVATLIGNPSLCPSPSGFRDQVCLARASRDPRLCSGILGERICRALVLGQPSLCDKDASCRRQVARWASLFEPPAEKEPFVTQLTVDVRETTSGASDRPSRAFDLGDLAAGGVVVRKRSTRIEASLGTPRDATWLPADRSLAIPRGHFSLRLARGSLEGAKLPLDPLGGRFDLLLPELASLSSVTGRAQGVFTIHELVPEPGGVVRLELEATITEGGRSFELRASVASFVRDVVELR